MSDYNSTQLKAFNEILSTTPYASVAAALKAKEANISVPLFKSRTLDLSCLPPNIETLVIESAFTERVKNLHKCKNLVALTIEISGLEVLHIPKSLKKLNYLSVNTNLELTADVDTDIQLTECILNPLIDIDDIGVRQLLSRTDIVSCGLDSEYEDIHNLDELDLSQAVFVELFCDTPVPVNIICPLAEDIIITSESDIYPGFIEYDPTVLNSLSIGAERMFGKVNPAINVSDLRISVSKTSGEVDLNNFPNLHTLELINVRHVNEKIHLGDMKTILIDSLDDEIEELTARSVGRATIKGTDMMLCKLPAGKSKKGDEHVSIFASSIGEIDLSEGTGNFTSVSLDGKFDSIKLPYQGGRLSLLRINNRSNDLTVTGITNDHYFNSFNMSTTGDLTWNGLGILSAERVMLSADNSLNYMKKIVVREK